MFLNLEFHSTYQSSNVKKMFLLCVKLSYETQMDDIVFCTESCYYNYENGLFTRLHENIQIYYRLLLSAECVKMLHICFVILHKLCI